MSIETRILRLVRREMRDNESLGFFDALTQAVNESAPVYNVNPTSCKDNAILEMAHRLQFDVTGLTVANHQDYMAHLSELIDQTERRSVLHFLGRV